MFVAVYCATFTLQHSKLGLDFIIKQVQTIFNNFLQIFSFIKCDCVPVPDVNRGEQQLDIQDAIYPASK